MITVLIIVLSLYLGFCWGIGIILKIIDPRNMDVLAIIGSPIFLLVTLFYAIYVHFFRDDFVK
jgi:hypothetical protein